MKKKSKKSLLSVNFPHAYIENWQKIVVGFFVLRRFQHCTGHIMTGSWKGRGNQYLQFVRVSVL